MIYDLDDHLCGTTYFYQHGIGRYYLTPRQYEQLKWREEVNRRRRVADMSEISNTFENYRRYKHRRMHSNEETTNTSKQHSEHGNACNYQSISTLKQQLTFRLEDEENENSLHRQLYPLIFQICKGPSGRVQRLPLPNSERPCHKFKATRKLLTILKEENENEEEYGVDTELHFRHTTDSRTSTLVGIDKVIRIQFSR